MILEKFEKQPSEIKHFDIHFEDFLAGITDTALSVVVTADSGVTQPTAASITAGVVKLWIAGGTDGTTYKVTIQLTTTGGWLEEQEIQVKVKEY